MITAKIKKDKVLWKVYDDSDTKKIYKFIYEELTRLIIQGVNSSTTYNDFSNMEYKLNKFDFCHVWDVELTTGEQITCEIYKDTYQ